MNLWNWRVSAALGSCLWGSWALYVNWPAGVRSAALSGLTQAAVSGGSISLLGVLADRVLTMAWRSTGAQVVAGTLIPYGVLLAIVVSAHLAVGTHDILTTILPSSTIGIIYSAVYAYKNRRPTPVRVLVGTSDAHPKSP